MVEYLDEYFEEVEKKEKILPVSFIDSNVEFSTTPIIMNMHKDLKIEEVYDRYKLPEAILDHSYMIPQQEIQFEEMYSSDEFDEPSDDEVLLKTKLKVEKNQLGKPQKHKLRQLTGKPACKYCDTIFGSKETLKMHVCKYLQCDPKNFICRICKKELSRKTFSNHLHETLDCQYCGKKFVNPRNMKMHIKSVHSDEKFIPPKSPNLSPFLKFMNHDEVIMEPVLDETTGLMVPTKAKKKYPRKTGRFECGMHHH